MPDRRTNDVMKLGCKIIKERGERIVFTYDQGRAFFSAIMKGIRYISLKARWLIILS